MGAMKLTDDERQMYSEQIRRIRLSKDWTRERLSDEADVPVPTIRGIEQGSCAQEVTLAKLLQALDVAPTTYGLMSTWVSDMIAVLAPLVAKIPADQLPEAMAVIMRVLSRVAQGYDVPTLDIGDGTQVNVVSGGVVDIGQHVGYAPRKKDH